MKIEKLRTNHIENPLGYKMDQISLSWVVTEAEGQKTARARVEIAADEAFTNIVCDSGEAEGIDALCYCPDIKPEDGVRYYWRVSVWDDAGDHARSDAAFFETAVTMDHASWITVPGSFETADTGDAAEGDSRAGCGGTPELCGMKRETHPVFFKKITVEKEIRRARLYISGLGLYEAYINGVKTGEEYLTPYNNDYNLWIQYQTYDVTGQLGEGENVIGVMLGNGWYKGRFGFVDQMDQLYGDRFLLICELHLTYADGRTQIVCSDESWRCAPSPALSGSLYDGEVWDARREGDHAAYLTGGLSDGMPAVCCDAPRGRLTPRLSLPVKRMETVKPAALIRTPAGEDVLDFGQNMTGWVEFECDEPEGKLIRFWFGEILQDGNFYNENLRTARQEFCYISGGKPAHVRPHFTFYGFRYVKVEGITHMDLTHFTGCVLYSEMEQTGMIRTSNPMVNRLFLNALWGQKGNFLDTPTDCPQRDERMGWTGDAQVFSATASLNMETPAFFRKYLYDMRLEQETLSGGVPHVVPDVLGQINRILYAGEEASDNIAVSSACNSCAWGDAATIIPWNIYQAYGDRTMLKEQYANMKGWTDHIRAVDVEKCGGRYLWTDGFHFADWLALDNYHSGSSFGATDPYYVASVFYYYSASLTAKAARVLDQAADAVYYEELAGHIKEAIQTEYFTATGRIAVPTQTAMVLALYFDLAKEEFRERLTQDLLQKLKDEEMHLTTGFVGTPFLCPALSECGLSEAAYTLLLNEDYPGWLYEIAMGATTIWERWNSVLADGRISDTGMNSLNHYSYGSIAEWMYRYMCGLKGCEDAPGYGHFQIKPYVDARLTWAEMEYLSVRGQIRSGWKQTKTGYCFQVEVPFDADAEFVFTADYTNVRLNGAPVDAGGAGSRIRLKKGCYEILADV